MSVDGAASRASRVTDAWDAGDAYEAYMGRWSRLIAADFVRWLGVPAGGVWLDVGCGTGALTAAIGEVAEPLDVIGVDPSEELVAHGADTSDPDVARFVVATATSLPFEDGIFDVSVSGLVLNFLADPVGALREQSRVVASPGTIAAYVWDYADGMRLLRHFWDAARRVVPSAVALDEAVRFPNASLAGLERLFDAAGLDPVDTTALETEATFRDFDELWAPFMSGQGPAPGFVASLDEDERAALRQGFAAVVPTGPDGSVRLSARAWAIRARN